ncbi:MAG: DUF2157 domain-containing protein [Motiliproteus sp.]|nr:DUF2157 domain-containing protein [Motiliproteus sp.]MCW9052423.1 DUF2157 domain-containing protein [Motiliproteus sp.]
MRLFRLFKKDMAREVSDWIGDELISSAQGEAILARYGTRLSDAKSNSFGYYVLTALAALFVGLAVILVVSHNWDSIPRMTRMLSLVGLTLIINLQGIRLILQDRYRPGTLWLFFGSICYGASIMLIAQIYHLGEHYPDGIFYWALGVLPVALLTQSRLITLLCLSLASLWMVVEAGTNFFPTSYPVFVFASLWIVWNRRHSVLLFLTSLVGLATWINLLLAWSYGDFYQFEPFIDQLPLTVAMGLSLAGFAWWMMRQSTVHHQDYGQVLHLWLLRGLIITLFILSFNDPWRELVREHFTWGFYTPAVLLMGAIIGVAHASQSGKKAVAPLMANGIFFIIAFTWISIGEADVDVLTVGSNFMLIFTGIWLIRRGIDDTVTHFFYTGVGVLLLTALARYFDLIGDYIGGAVLFVVAAAVMYGAARYWRFRQLQEDSRHA